MKKIFYLSILALSFAACKKENNAKDFNGTYTGTFKTVLNNKTTVSEFEMLLALQEFSIKKADKTGSGAFKVEDSKLVKFNDRNYWTADFDWNLILNGTYIYEAKGDSLILTKVMENSPNSLYQYRLKRLK